VAVKRDWVPALWSPDDPMLTAVNSNMANIDLTAEMFGPLAAGALLQWTGEVTGFGLVGLINVLSFGLELLLLRAVYDANGQLAAVKPTAPAGAAKKGPLGELCTAWPIFLGHPSGIPLLVTSYALLYFTVLSPHGVVLTAYLQTRDLPPPALAAFRAAGALSGVAGMACFRLLSSRLGLRRVASVHLWLLAIAVLIAASCFAATHSLTGLSAPMAAFLALLVVSRFGLYGFDLAVLQLQQIHVDEKYRSTIGAVESSLCSLGTASLFVATMLCSTADVSSFDPLVYASAGFVSSAAVVYVVWLLFFHEHEHAHPLFGEEQSTAPHTHVHGAKHKHTSQQQKTLEDSAGRTHVHLHFHPPFSHALQHLRGHDHGHGH